MSKATREAYGATLAKLGRENSAIVALDADLSGSTKSADFKKVFPDRFFNVGIAEQNLMGIAAGMATVGLVPFASTFAMFATGRAFEQIRNSICYPNLNVKIVGSHSGLTVGEDGATHQALEDIALMRSLPNMVVIVPSDVKETEAAIEAAAEHYGPVYIRTGRMAVPDIHPEGIQFEIGKAQEIRHGHDVAIIAAGICVKMAMDAAEELSNQGISARVLNMSTIKPIDRESIVRAARECKGVVTVEEHTIFGGLGSAVAEVIVENHPVRMKRVGVNDQFGQSGKPQDLLEVYGLTANAVVQAAHNVLQEA